MYQSVELLIPLGGMLLVFGIVYLGVTAQNRKNLAMIEAGMNPDVKIDNKQNTLKNALLLIFIPLGFFVGEYLEDVLNISYTNLMGIIGAFLFGGIALLLFYIFGNRKDSEELNA